MRFVLFTLGIIIASTMPCMAYLDPGSGSTLFQLLIAGAVGGLYLVKQYWTKIRLWFRRIIGKDKKD